MKPEEIENPNKSYNILHFKEGDIITRVERAPFKTKKYNENLDTTIIITKHADGSYMGDKLKFLGVFNRQICVERLDGFLMDKKDRSKNMVKLHIDQWKDGWQIYQIPELK